MGELVQLIRSDEGLNARLICSRRVDPGHYIVVSPGYAVMFETEKTDDGTKLRMKLQHEFTQGSYLMAKGLFLRLSNGLLIKPRKMIFNDEGRCTTVAFDILTTNTNTAKAQ